MHLVKLTKISTSKNPICPPGNWDTYKPGKLNNGRSLPVDYEIIGILQAPPVVGQSVRVLRINRNGVHRLGEFKSTEVVELTQDGFKTLNSVYRLVVLSVKQCFAIGMHTEGPTPSQRAKSVGTPARQLWFLDN